MKLIYNNKNSTKEGNFENNIESMTFQVYTCIWATQVHVIEEAILFEQI